LRFRHPDLFLHGSYTPVSAEGVLRDHVVAFARSFGPTTMLTIAPRLVAGLTGDSDHLPVGSKVWSDTVLPLPRQWQSLVWRDALTGQELTSDNGGSLPLARILDTCPISLLLATTPTNGEEPQQ
jgi:(1->4)-alpha-D-glucan 1-alpha-D-glucosylmutase